MFLARFEALFVAQLHLVAGRGPQVVNLAADLSAKLTLQGRTTGLARIRALHAPNMRCHHFSQLNGHRATRGIVGLSPIKRDPKAGATSATGLAWMQITHSQLIRFHCKARLRQCSSML